MMINLKYFFLLGFLSMGIYAGEHSIKAVDVIKQKCCEAANLNYEKAVNSFKTDPSRPLISHLVNERNRFFWETLILYGYEKTSFTAQDLKWVIEQYSSPECYLGQEISNLFELMIFKHEQKNLNAQEVQAIDYKSQVADIISQVSFINTESSLERGASCFVSPLSKERLDSILIICIENNYHKAFLEILQIFPDFVKNAHKQPLCQRQERADIKTAGYLFNEYNYITAEYSLLGWITRGEGKYLFANKPRDNYIKAIQIIIRELLKQGSESNKNIHEDLYKIMLKLQAKELLSAEDMTRAAFCLIKS